LSESHLNQSERDKFNTYLKEIEDTLIKNGEHTKNTWKEIYNHLQGEFKKDTVDWGCHLSINNSSLGTFRITKWKEVDDTGSKIKNWSSAWFYTKKITTNKSYPNDILEEIFKDITTLIGNPFWQFPIYFHASQTSTALYSWHSDRVDASDRDQQNRIKENIPLPPQFKGTPEPIIYCMTSLHTVTENYLDDIGDINEFVNWIEGKEIIEDNSSPTSRFNTLEFLLEREFLKENDRLVYNLPNDYMLSKMEKTKIYGTLVIQDGQPKVKWDYDGNIYSISTLTKQMLLERKKISPSTNPDGNKYWHLKGSEITSLYDLAIHIRKDDEEDPTIKLF
jgi:hypothetical protein